RVQLTLGWQRRCEHPNCEHGVRIPTVALISSSWRARRSATIVPLSIKNSRASRSAPLALMAAPMRACLILVAASLLAALAGPTATVPATPCDFTAHHTSASRSFRAWERAYMVGVRGSGDQLVLETSSPMSTFLKIAVAMALLVAAIAIAVTPPVSRSKD